MRNERTLTRRAGEVGGLFEDQLTIRRSIDHPEVDLRFEDQLTIRRSIDNS